MGNLHAYALPAPGAATYQQYLKIPICHLYTCPEVKGMIAKCRYHYGDVITSIKAYAL